MNRLQELVAQRNAIDADIETEKSQNREQLLTALREQITNSGFTVAEIAPLLVRRPRVPPKYRNPETGATWSGRGKRPSWMDDEGVIKLNP